MYKYIQEAQKLYDNENQLLLMFDIHRLYVGVKWYSVWSVFPFCDILQLYETFWRQKSNWISNSVPVVDSLPRTAYVSHWLTSQSLEERLFLFYSCNPVFYLDLHICLFHQASKIFSILWKALVHSSLRSLLVLTLPYRVV